MNHKYIFITVTVFDVNQAFDANQAFNFFLKQQL